MPTDPQTVHYDEADLASVLNEIENILDNSTFDDCIIAGDFNFDERRVSGFATTVRDFLKKVGLTSVWNKFQADFTHMHTDYISTSIIDHFFVNSSLLDHIIYAGPLHLGDNRSSHSPIMLKLQLNDIPTCEKQEQKTELSKPA